MTYQEAKATLIESWGILGSSWGINKTMAQIHILLMISPKPLCTEDVMESLDISRGNANMNLRSLVDWGIVHKKFIPGERKEYFSSIKDIWEMARIVAKERRKRELEPALKVLRQIQHIEDAPTPEIKEFLKVTGELADFSEKADHMLDAMSKLEQNKLLKFMISIV